MTQHDPSVFQDPDEFIPKRWIENNPDRLAEMEQAMLAFGYGARLCLGKHITGIEMIKPVPEILREFTVTLTYPEKEWRVINQWFVL